MGDFNFNVIEKESRFEKYLNTEHHLVKALGDQITANNDTQIDVIFTKNITKYHCNVYETYFSDHKPIFIGVSSDLNSKKNEFELNTSKLRNDCSTPTLMEQRKRKKVDNVSKLLKIKKKILESEEEKITQVEVIDVESYDGFDMPIRSNEEIESELLRKILGEINTDFKHLTDDTMNRFGELINHHFREYNFQPTFYLTDALHRVVSVIDKNDIQFLFQKGATLEAIGHWICIFYRHTENKVLIFDSMNGHVLDREHEKSLKNLYPRIDIKQDVIFKEIRNEQTNASACGVYSIAYAVTLALGKDPTTLNLKICYLTDQDESKFLRAHLLKMIRESRISFFPEEEN